MKQDGCEKGRVKNDSAFFYRPEIELQMTSHIFLWYITKKVHDRCCSFLLLRNNVIPLL